MVVNDGFKVISPRYEKLSKLYFQMYLLSQYETQYIILLTGSYC